jgi:hypothetical protein
MERFFASKLEFCLDFVGASCPAPKPLVLSGAREVAVRHGSWCAGSASALHAGPLPVVLPTLSYGWIDEDVHGEAW